MEEAAPHRNKVFISYSHKDTSALQRLQVHLRPLEREGLIERWDDTRITAGQRWLEEIKKALASAKVAVVLISADFLASDFIHSDELPLLLAAEEKDGLVVMPVIVKPSRFEQTQSLSQFHAVNASDKPLISLSEAEQEAVWVKLTEAIEAALNRLPNNSEELQKPSTRSTPTKTTNLQVESAAIADPSTKTKNRYLNWPKIHPTIFVAVITGIVSLIVGYWQYASRLTPAAQNEIEYTGRVMDELTLKPIHNAKVSIEQDQKVPQIETTDSEGIFHTRLSTSTQDVRVRVQANDYKPFDRIVSLSRRGLESISLTPVQQATPTPGTPVDKTVRRLNPDSSKSSSQESIRVNQYVSNCESKFTAQKYREALNDCNNALRLDPRNTRARELKTRIEKTIRILDSSN